MNDIQQVSTPKEVMAFPLHIVALGLPLLSLELASLPLDPGQPHGFVVDPQRRGYPCPAFGGINSHMQVLDVFADHIDGESAYSNLVHQRYSGCFFTISKMLAVRSSSWSTALMPFSTIRFLKRCPIHSSRRYSSTASCTASARDSSRSRLSYSARVARVNQYLSIPYFSVSIFVPES